MLCINQDCHEEIETGAEFCPFCGADQTLTIQTETPPGRASTVPFADATTRPQTYASAAKPSQKGDVLEMRAGESIWNFTEPEKDVRPGQRRPTLIMDEQTVHLDHTDQRLTADELLNRVKLIIQEQDVPVDVRLMETRWMSDETTRRPRLVASLRDHPFSDIKMIMGVDYMGKWASIQLHLGTEPEPLQPEPEDEKWTWPTDAIIALSLGLLFFLAGLSARDGGGIAVLGFFGMLYGGARAFYSKKLHTEKMLAKKALHLAEKKVREFQKTVERLSRTFKVDDMRLFCTAMRAVFQRVVDDIVQTGGQIVRVEGGKGGFFEADKTDMPAPAARRTDAAEVGV